MAEAEQLVKAGVKELLVISQDTSRLRPRHQICGEPVEGRRRCKARFLDLSRALGDLGAWVRLHYVYPYPARRRRHSADGRGQDPALSRHPVSACLARGLKAMRRPAAQEKTLERIRRWREICPDLAIRSTFIVGFPGETEEDFADAARVARRSQDQPRRLLQVRARRRRHGQRTSRRRARRGQGRALAPLHGGAEARSARRCSRRASAARSTC